MELDTVFSGGDRDKPAVVFIHGLGMNKDIWVKPSDARILAGQFPLKILLGKKFADEQGVSGTLYDDLRRRGYSVVTWTQKRPAGPIESVIPEMDHILKVALESTRCGIVLIGHSRGGLIGRRYLSKVKGPIRCLITISTPHKGSSIARISKYLSPVVSMLDPLVPAGDKGTLSFSVKRIFDFLRSGALKELLPESNFFKTLDDGPFEDVHYVSVGGTRPTLFTYHNVRFPDALENIIPDNFYPEEMKMGLGDGLVTVESSRLPWSDEHHDFEYNHAEILFDEEVRHVLRKVVARIR
jgi:pimeloyl-ACP methyl ester carboxylesterase